ncbi:hypothetical protein, partial [uncultured Boseongicola sp.]|uniref:hypothetical protein n=1 Tax=uncultured Boseongicola sp. TaxID=1648499 RepID=UPI0026237F98
MGLIVAQLVEVIGPVSKAFGAVSFGDLRGHPVGDMGLFDSVSQGARVAALTGRDCDMRATGGKV